MGLISKHLCSAHRMYVWHACTNALDDTTRPSGAPRYGIRPVLTLMWYNQNFKIIFLSFYLTILGQIDNTSQRKLAHIQRLILLNYCFNSFTDRQIFEDWIDEVNQACRASNRGFSTELFKKSTGAVRQVILSCNEFTDDKLVAKLRSCFSHALNHESSKRGIAKHEADGT